MTAILSNFITVRKQRGDVLSPAEYRSAVEMIRGILKQYDYSGFNVAYQSFLTHLADFKDPHHYTQTSFVNEFIERTYAIYRKMTASPVTEDVFNTTIVPSLSFLELIRRIIINRATYTAIKNPDGSVPKTVSISIGADWGRISDAGSSITVDFGSPLISEDDFLSRGWGVNSLPFPIVFSADNLDLETSASATIFHSSSIVPNFTPDGISQGYPIGLFGASNDMSGIFKTVGTPTVKTPIFTFSNGTNNLIISMTAIRSIEVRLDNTILIPSASCGDGHCRLKFSRQGRIDLSTSHNGQMLMTTVMTNFSSVSPFITGIIGVPMEDKFSNVFGFREITIQKEIITTIPTNEPIPMIFYTPPSGVTPVEGSSASSGNSSSLIPAVGYNVYIALTGTWEGTVQIQKSIDGGLTWNSVTEQGSVIGVYTQNCDEVAFISSDTRARYRLKITPVSGDVNFRLGQ